MEEPGTSQHVAELKRRTRALSLKYAEQALTELEDLPVSTDPKSASQQAETWGEIFDTLRKISTQLDESS